LTDPTRGSAFRFLILLFAFFLSPLSLVASENEFFVGSHGWHSSIIIARRQIPKDAWPPGVADRTFAESPYLEIGWGDRKFYTAPKPGVAMALDAALSPGPSVLHIVGLQSPRARALPWSALVRVPRTPAKFGRLCHALGDSFERDANGNVRAIGPGLYGKTSRFYPAQGRYYMFNTCDTWTARIMRAGGLPARTNLFATRSSGAIIAQARHFADSQR
jgi:uncharacterized protein (TIGR02117 family)